MNERLEEAVAELARQLGVGAGELWDYLRDGGLRSYCMAKAVQNMPVAIVSLVVFVACALGARAAYKKYMRLDDYKKESSVLSDVVVTLAVFAFIALIAFVCASSNLIGWIVAPDGMIIDKLIGAIG